VALALTFVIGVGAACSSGGSTARTDREFGVALDPWHVDDWANAVGAKPTMVMEFEAWSHNRTLDQHFQQAEQAGLQSFMVTWEPWSPVDSAAGTEAQYAIQPAYSNQAIAQGKQDAYIHTFAKSVAQTKLTVYIRWGHEMNGNWYPWARDPADYIAAWRHIVKIFRDEHADNAKFVFSLNPQLFLKDDAFLATAKAFYPGDDYVDYLGSSMINFGGSMQNDVVKYADRVRLMHATFNKPTLLTEVNTAADGRVAWFTELRSWLTQDSAWLKGAVLSQGQSRGKVSLGEKVGDVDWDVQTDAESRPVIKSIIEDVRSPSE
jgi:hypothetical protein